MILYDGVRAAQDDPVLPGARGGDVVEEPAAAGANVIGHGVLQRDVVQPDAAGIRRRARPGGAREMTAVEQRGGRAEPVDHRRAGHAVQRLACPRFEDLRRQVGACIQAERGSGLPCRQIGLDVRASRDRGSPCGAPRSTRAPPPAQRPGPPHQDGNGYEPRNPPDLSHPPACYCIWRLRPRTSSKVTACPPPVRAHASPSSLDPRASRAAVVA